MSQEIRTGKKRKTGDEMHKSEVHRNGKSRNGMRENGKNRKETAGSGCPYVKKCGGCNMLDGDYAGHLKLKQKLVEGYLQGICKVMPITGMQDPYHYRNKVHAVYANTKQGVISGVYQEGTHRVVPVEECRIEDRKADQIIQDIRGLLKSFRMKAYDEDRGFGFLRHVLIRRGFHSGEIMVVLVTGTPVFPSKNHFIKALRKLHPEITTIIQNINDRKTSMVLGEREILLYGKGYIEDQLCGKTFRISAKSFYQVNPVQTEFLYGKAVELAGLTGKERVIDAYCGIGTIGLIASDGAAETLGIELNPDAVRDAIRNAKVNGVKNIRFYQADAGAYMVQMAEQGEHADVVFMDPPRAGSDEAFLSSVVKLAPERIVYISCNPETLARDLKYLVKQGYVAGEAWPYDMFPWTGHVETVVLLSKGEIDSKKVRVEFSLEDMDMSGFQKGATYEQIKAYVLEHTGLKVSSLYISQIKRKCGLDVGQNYNLSKKEDAKVPKCPPEKEAAIRDALKYFQMI